MIGLPRKLLMVSGSARMLAQSAARAGLRPVALDLYADADTRQCAEAAEAIPASGAGFDRSPLLDAAARLAPAADYPLIYGSGLDAAPDVLEDLAKGRELIGNSPGVLRRLRSPRQFFDLLRECGVGHPEVRYHRPADPENWLIKAGCSEGGKRVRFCAQEQAGPEEYYQRRLPGPARSALFLADGRMARILGFNTLWTAGNAERPYLFGGAINRALLTQPQREQIRIHVARLVEALALRGLNSLDFMVDGDTCRILEINGRPSATLALYDADFPEGLVAAHIKACRGQINASGASGSSVRAFRVFFAPETLRIPAHMVWPSWCADRPVAGSAVNAGHPLCTIEAVGHSTAEVLALIGQRETRLIQSIPETGAQHT